MGGLSWWHWLIILAVFILLFGAKKLPDAARGVGRSLRILKSEVSAMHEDEERAKKTQPSETDATAAVPTPTAQIVGTPAPAPVQYPAASTAPVVNGVPVVNAPASAPASNPVPVDDQRT
jgi:sec-independent protein translocase protein TatA